MTLGVEAELYCKDEGGVLTLRTPKVAALPDEIPPLVTETLQMPGRICLPLRGKVSSAPKEDFPYVDILGILVIAAEASLPASDLFFLEKFAGRVGFSLHNKILTERSMRHVDFVRKLAHDIGHNVITPNMRMKLLLLQLENQLETFGTIIHESKGRNPDELTALHAHMMRQYADLMGQFKNGAMFLESLLRQSHFDLGHYALRCIPLDLIESVVKPQFERYRPYMEERDIIIEPAPLPLSGIPCRTQADLGLISQSLANLLGNAVKYTAPAADGKKRMRCEVVVVPQMFGERDGVKVTVYSTGERIGEEDEPRLFDDSFRAANAGAETGTGHGLYFVRAIVTEHGGQAGYERVGEYNGFYFVLPLEDPQRAHKRQLESAGVEEAEFI